MEYYDDGNDKINDFKYDFNIVQCVIKNDR